MNFTVVIFIIFIILITLFVFKEVNSEKAPMRGIKFRQFEYSDYDGIDECVDAKKSLVNVKPIKVDFGFAIEDHEETYEEKKVRDKDGLRKFYQAGFQSRPSKTSPVEHIDDPTQGSVIEPVVEVDDDLIQEPAVESVVEIIDVLPDELLNTPPDEKLIEGPEIVEYRPVIENIDVKRVVEYTPKKPTPIEITEITKKSTVPKNFLGNKKHTIKKKDKSSSSKSNKFKCPVCKKEFKTKRGVAGHLNGSKDQAHTDYRVKHKSTS